MNYMNIILDQSFRLMQENNFGLNMSTLPVAKYGKTAKRMFICFDLII